MNECPGDSIIQRYHAGELPEEQEALLEEHLKQCPTCTSQSNQALAKFDALIHRVKDLKLSSTGLKTKNPTATSAGTMAPAKLIEGYEIVRELHRGGQGVVYQAVQKSTKRRVAIKVLLEGPYASEAARRRFEREIELVASLKHPNIVAVFDSGRTADGHEYCVMDYVQGERLESYQQQKRMHLEDVLRLFALICDAINYAHQKGVIHRDLKPWNIVVEESGQPKILDFGLAKAVVGPVDPLLSVTGQIVGTLPYLSPEQSRGKLDELDTRTDIYALGVILYEMLTGQLPYTVSGDVPEALRNITQTPAAPMNKAWKSGVGVLSRTDHSNRCPLDPEIETIVNKALAKERERRYQSAGELGADIRHYLAGEPIEAKRDSHWYMLSKTLRRYKVGACVAAAVVLLLSVSTVIAWNERNKASASAKLARSERNKAIASEKLAQSERIKAVASAKLARERFDLVRELAHSFIFDVHDKVVNLPGSLPARQFIVTTALDYLDRLRKSATEDADLRRELGAAYTKIGNIQGGTGYSNRGNVSGALKSYQQALELFKANCGNDENKGLATDRRSIAVTYNKIGDMLTETNHTAEARQHYERALGICESLARENPTDLQFKRDLGISYNRLGNLIEREGKYADALAMQEKAMDTWQMLCKADPNNSLFAMSQAVGLNKIAELQAALDQNDKALASYRQLVILSDAAIKKDPNSLWAQRGLTLGYDGEANMFAQAGKRDDALIVLTKSREITEKLAASDPADATLQRDLHIGYARQANLLDEMNRHTDALVYHRKGLLVIEELIKKDAANARWALDLGIALQNYGASLAKTGDRAQARTVADRSLQTFEKLFQENPKDTRSERNRAMSSLLLGSINADMARHAPDADRMSLWMEAHRYYLRAQNELREMQRRNVLSASDSEYLKDIEDGLNHCAKALGGTAAKTATSGPSS